MPKRRVFQYMPKLRVFQEMHELRVFQEMPKMRVFQGITKMRSQISLKFILKSASNRPQNRHQIGLKSASNLASYPDFLWARHALLSH